MNTPTQNPGAPAQAVPLTLSPGKAWLVGGGMALVALLSLATALTLRGPEASPDAGLDTRPHALGAPAEARETIVSTLSPAPAYAPTAAISAIAALAPAGPALADCAVVASATAIERRASPGKPARADGDRLAARSEEAPARPRSMAEAKRL